MAAEAMRSQVRYRPRSHPVRRAIAHRLGLSITDGVDFKARSIGRSRKNDDGRAILDEGPDLIHLVIGDRQTTIGPIVVGMIHVDCSPPVGQAMNHDEATR